MHWSSRRLRWKLVWVKLPYCVCLVVMPETFGMALVHTHINALHRFACVWMRSILNRNLRNTAENVIHWKHTSCTVSKKLILSWHTTKQPASCYQRPKRWRSSKLPKCKQKLPRWPKTKTSFENCRMLPVLVVMYVEKQIVVFFC